MPPADNDGTAGADELSALRAMCETLARGAGEIALAGRREAIGATELAGTTKSSTTDIATEFDEAAEAHVVGLIRDLRPDDAIIGEEGTADPGTSGYSWYIDPIDGTTNYVYDQPAWSNSVAVAHGDEMIAAAVYVPPLDEMFAAAAGQGATLNGRTISASDETDLSLALVGTGFGYQPSIRREQAERLVRLITQVRDVRRLGSAAVDLCMVACGRLDVYYELYLNSWDAAAGELIARESGAVTTDFTGAPARPEEMVAAAPGVHAAFLEALQAS
ncbi:inositol monophosphatase family protein [Ilumatobacter sp.]|uniref:inositol monophosphatase family protein n=1 Tax=Ilumatobacter sp. TaxID=1967498 RepID=UPI003AF5AD63